MSNKEKKTYYITTPIYYPSAKLHIGHTYCTTIADSLARFHRLRGDDTLFITRSKNSTGCRSTGNEAHRVCRRHCSLV